MTINPFRWCFNRLAGDAASSSEIAFKSNYQKFLDKYDVDGSWGLPADTAWHQLSNGIKQAAIKMNDLPKLSDPNSSSYNRVLYNEHDAANNGVVGTFEQLTAAERMRRIKAGEDVIDIPDVRFTKSSGFKEAQMCLQPFFDTVGSLMALAFETATRSHHSTGSDYPCIFWSFCGARDCALKWCEDNGGGILMNNTIGMLMDSVDVTSMSELAHWPGEIWVSFSEIYARLAAVNSRKLKFMNFIGPGADQSESVWEQMESRTLSQIATTLYNPGAADASGVPEIMVKEWYVVPTHIVTQNGKEVVSWTGESALGNSPSMVRQFGTQAEAFAALPGDYTKQQLLNSFILLGG